VSVLVVLFVCEAPDLTIISPTAENIAKSTQATRDFNHLLQLGTDMDGSIVGDVSLDHVLFCYLKPPDVEIFLPTSPAANA
jgi:hypothetical protein